MTSTNPRVSFIVPVRNDAARLETCLRSILGNGLPANTFEIIVADNGSSDDSVDVARRHGAKVIVVAGVRVSALRNVAARRATGDILAFVDADNEIAPSWGRALFESLGTDAAGAAGAAYRSPDDGTWVQRAYGVLRGSARGIHDVDWLGSGNLAVPRHVFDAVGGFDTTLEACEDVDLCTRIRARGLRIVSDARLDSVHHGDPASLWSLFRGELWRGRDNLRVSFRAPVSWRSALSALIAVADALMIVVAMVGVMVGLRRGLEGLVIVGSALGIVAGVAFVRAFRAVIRGGMVNPGAIVQTFAVMCVYDLARALALITRVPHRGRRPASPVEAS